MRSGDEPRLRAFLRAMHWDSTKDAADIDTSGWSFTGETPEQVRDALIALIKTKNIRLSQLFEHLDTSDDNVCERGEWLGSLGAIGFKGDSRVIEECVAAHRPLRPPRRRRRRPGAARPRCS